MIAEFGTQYSYRPKLSVRENKHNGPHFKDGQQFFFGPVTKSELCGSSEG